MKWKNKYKKQSPAVLKWGLGHLCVTHKKGKQWVESVLWLTPRFTPAPIFTLGLKVWVLWSPCNNSRENKCAEASQLLLLTWWMPHVGANMLFCSYLLKLPCLRKPAYSRKTTRVLATSQELKQTLGPAIEFPDLGVKIPHLSHAVI